MSGNTYDDVHPAVEVEYRPAALPAWARTRNLSPAVAAVDTVVLMDGLGRVIQTKKSAEVAVDEEARATALGWSVTGPQRFDGLGRVVEQGQAFFEAGSSPAYRESSSLHPTRFAYDALDRKTQVEEPVEPGSNAQGSPRALTAMAYDFEAVDGIPRFRSAVTDPEGKVRRMYRDPGGRVTAVEERNGSERYLTRYEYDALGQLAAVLDARGNATRLTYDLLGRRSSLSNPDAGLVFPLSPTDAPKPHLALAA